MLHCFYWLFVLALASDVSSEYGYDSASACGRELRKVRARELPCDFTRQNWCTVAGSSYPWSAVRKFVRENHGLMKRMYGNERHINVLQAEIDSNDINFDDIKNTQQRYSNRRGNRRRNDDSLDDLSDRTPRLLYSDIPDDDFNNKIEPRPRMMSPNDVLLNTKFTFADAEFRPNDLFTLSHFRPMTPTTPKIATTTTSTETNEIKDSVEWVNIPEVISNDLDTNNVFNLTNLTVIVIDENDKAYNNGTETIQNQTTLRQEEVTLTTEDVEMQEETTTEQYTTTDTETTATEGGELDITTENIGSNVPIAGDKIDDFRDEDLATMESQLFQDVDQELAESDPEPVKLKGVNACPVKEEVVSPFWANNTRGEILALLNLYPFEQYVHWEKCTFEHEQMYCREGCRCEQQYQLHRMLAYDPNNECRGIFSDWFRFPSCCVCKCYDMPVEFRVTSRSPRVRPRRPKMQGRRAKIDPVWYRPDLPTQNEGLL